MALASVESHPLRLEEKGHALAAAARALSPPQRRGPDCFLGHVAPRARPCSPRLKRDDQHRQLLDGPERQRRRATACQSAARRPRSLHPPRDATAHPSRRPGAGPDAADQLRTGVPGARWVEVRAGVRRLPGWARTAAGGAPVRRTAAGPRSDRPVCHQRRAGRRLWHRPGRRFPGRSPGDRRGDRPGGRRPARPADHGLGAQW